MVAISHRARATTYHFKPDSDKGLHRATDNPAAQTPRISRREFLSLCRAHPPLAEILNEGTLLKFNDMTQINVKYQEKRTHRNTEQVGTLTIIYEKQSYEVPVVFDISHGFRQITDQQNPNFDFLLDRQSLLNAIEIGTNTDLLVSNDIGYFCDPDGNARDCREYGTTISLADIPNLRQQILHSQVSLQAIAKATEGVLKDLLQMKTRS